MEMQEVKEIARKLAIKTMNLNKCDLIRAIQSEEGNIPCFGIRHTTECGQITCPCVRAVTYRHAALQGDLQPLDLVQLLTERLVCSDSATFS